MISRSLHNSDLFKIIDEETNKISIGCSQDWFRIFVQRRSGCGPSTVSNIIYYLLRSRVASDNPPLTKKEFVHLMEEIWLYVTPAVRGIPTAGLLCAGAERYIKFRKLPIKLDILDVPEDKSSRPDFLKLFAFISEGLKNDTPVAFLNLNSGRETQLDSWHWMTIISVDYDDERETAMMEVVDRETKVRADLTSWYRTTTFGGGFVRFDYI